MKKLFYLLTAAFAVMLTCVSCNKIEDTVDESNFNKLIVGTWKTEKSYDIETDSFEYDTTVAKFKSNGKVTMSYDDGNGVTINWHISGSTLRLELDGEEETYNIKKLNKKEMELAEISDGKEKEILYFNRIK